MIPKKGQFVHITYQGAEMKVWTGKIKRVDNKKIALKVGHKAIATIPRAGIVNIEPAGLGETMDGTSGMTGW